MYCILNCIEKTLDKGESIVSSLVWLAFNLGSK